MAPEAAVSFFTKNIVLIFFDVFDNFRWAFSSANNCLNPLFYGMVGKRCICSQSLYIVQKAVPQTSIYGFLGSLYQPHRDLKSLSRLWDSLLCRYLRERSRYLIFIVVLGQFLLPSCSLRLSSSAIGSSARLRR